MAAPGVGWEATASALSPLLPGGRPRLTAELLARPPFRFIHDVVSAVQQSTGFPAAGLFAATEMDPRAMDKDAKSSYLSKLLDAISGALGQPVPARLSKIIAGLEPEATNTMLQMLAAAATGGSAPKSTASPRGAASRYAPPPGASRGPRSSSDSEAGQDAEQPEVVFARADNLLPALSRRCAEARAALAGGAAPGSQEALALCDQVAAIAADAAVLAQCLEALQGAGPAIAAEGAAWRQEADKLAARLAVEEQAEAQAAAASGQRMASLEAQLGAAQQRLAAAAGRR